MLSLKDLSERLSSLLPMAEEKRKEVRSKIEQILREALSQLDILSTDDFEAQSRALTRAQDRISELENLLLELEGRLRDLESRQAALHSKKDSSST